MTKADFDKNVSNGIDFTLLSLLGNHFNYNLYIKNLRNPGRLRTGDMVTDLICGGVDIGGCGINNYISDFSVSSSNDLYLRSLFNNSSIANEILFSLSKS